MDMTRAAPPRSVGRRPRAGLASAPRPSRCSAAGNQQALRCGPGAVRGRPRPPGGPGDRAVRRQRRRQVRLTKTHRRHPPARPGRDVLGRPPRPHPQPEGRGRPRDRDRLPGPRARRQPGHRPEHVPRPGAPDQPHLPQRGQHGAGRRGDAGQPACHHRPLDPPARRHAVGRPAPGRRRGQGRHVELQARDARRADRGARRGPDPDGARPRQAAQGSRPRRHGHLPQPQRRLRGRRPDRRPAPRPHGRPGRALGLRPPERGGLHDHRRIEPPGGRRPAPTRGGTEQWLGSKATPGEPGGSGRHRSRGRDRAGPHRGGRRGHPAGDRRPVAGPVPPGLARPRHGAATPASCPSWSPSSPSRSSSRS